MKREKQLQLGENELIMPADFWSGTELAMYFHPGTIFHVPPIYWYQSVLDVKKEHPTSAFYTDRKEKFRIIEDEEFLQKGDLYFARDQEKPIANSSLWGRPLKEIKAILCGVVKYYFVRRETRIEPIFDEPFGFLKDLA